jgi:hypothetical protein
MQAVGMTTIAEYRRGMTARARHRPRAASFLDNILKGVKSADRPVAQPIKFELINNFGYPKAQICTNQIV